MQQRALGIQLRYWRRAQISKLSSPSAAMSLSELARRVGVSRQTVHRWWHGCPQYKAAFHAALAARFQQRRHRNDVAEQARQVAAFNLPGQTPDETLDLSERARRNAVHAAWPGEPVRSMADGQLYDDPDSYFQHLEASGMRIWTEEEAISLLDSNKNRRRVVKP